ncbi:MAG: hypothetical protein U0031_03095 [Thermomicrobiales bacterium]
MTTNPHPYSVTMATRERQVEILALCERERTARQMTRPDHAPRRADRPLVMVARVLTHLPSGAGQTVFPLRSIRISRV